jgi:hypothetical protein
VPLGFWRSEGFGVPRSTCARDVIVLFTLERRPSHGDEKPVIALRTLWNEQLEQAGQDEIGRLAVLLAAAGQDKVVERRAIGPKGMQRLQEQLTTIRLNGVHQRTAVNPLQPREENRAGSASAAI